MQRWSLFDYLDPHRVRGGFDQPFWDPTYAQDASDGTKDWTHGNSVVHDPRDDSLLVSLRHQDWILKLERESGELLWRFGPEGDFALANGDWSYHQHAPELQDDGSLLIYDNGNGRESLAEGQLPYSRVVQYELDEETMVASEVWEYRGAEPYYAPFLGDADRLDNGNVLIVDGGLVADPVAPVIALHNHKQARLREVTPDGEVVFELLTPGFDVSAAVGRSWSVYRAERVQLFP